MLGMLMLFTCTVNFELDSNNLKTVLNFEVAWHAKICLNSA